MFTTLGQLTYEIYQALSNIATQISDNITILTGTIASIGIGLVIINLILNVINWYNKSMNLYNELLTFFKTFLGTIENVDLGEETINNIINGLSLGLPYFLTIASIIFIFISFLLIIVFLFSLGKKIIC